MGCEFLGLQVVGEKTKVNKRKSRACCKSIPESLLGLFILLELKDFAGHLLLGLDIENNVIFVKRTKRKRSIAHLLNPG